MSFRGSAATVVARLFRLIKPDGSVVADFTANGPVGINNPALRFYHNSTHSSYLAWTNPDTEPDSHSITLTTDPTGVTNAAITLGHDDATSSDTCVIQIGVVAAVQIDPLVTKLIGQSLELETTLGVIISTPGGTFIDNGAGSPGRQVLFPTFIDAVAGTAGTQVGTVVGANITGLTISIPNCLVGDVITVEGTIAMTRAAAAGGGAFAILSAGCTNATLIGNNIGVPRMATLNDIAMVPIKVLFECSTAGTCTTTIAFSSSTAGDYSVVRDWCNMLVRCESPR